MTRKFILDVIPRFPWSKQRIRLLYFLLATHKHCDLTLDEGLSKPKFRRGVTPGAPSCPGYSQQPVTAYCLQPR
jgi:hypothetical protein